MEMTGIVESIMDSISLELIAKSNLTSDANAGDTTISVENSFRFHSGQEVVLIDYGYTDKTSSHFKKYEYSVVKTIVDTNTIILTTPLIDNWLVSNTSSIQKTIGHSPLYSENVFFGDREVIPTDDIAITVEPGNVTNEWIYLQGGLSEESRLTIIIYGQSVKTEEGMKILSKYTKAVYDLLNGSLHLNINDYQAPLTRDIVIGDDRFYICNTTDNLENFVVSDNGEQYTFQDNITPRCTRYEILSRTVVGEELCLETSCAFNQSFSRAEFGVAGKMNRYFYDTRVDNVTFGKIQKGSAILRASELSWFGKEVNELSFPQHDRKVICFDPDEVCGSSSSD